MSPNFIGLSLWFFFCGVLTLVHSKTDSKDVTALNVMFTSLNSPKKLKDWESDGGDPCGDGWKGIECSKSSVTEINLSGLGLTGSLGYQLSNLASVTYFDVSNNKLSGDIPYQLPPNVKHLDLSNNGFTGTVPYSVSLMKSLKDLDLSHNQLNGQITDMFSSLSNLDLLDLSFNKLSGSLPQSFESLSSLSTLYLQNNQLNGQINVLGKLKLDELNIANNKFSGWIPNELTKVKKIDIEGNSWSSGQPPPGMTSSGNIKSTHMSKGGLSGAMIAAIIMGVLVVVATFLAILSRKRSSFSSSLYDEQDNQSGRKSFNYFGSNRYSTELGIDKDKGFKDHDIKALQSSGPIGLKPSLSYRMKSFRNNEPVNNAASPRKVSFEITPYALSELQTATSNFAMSRLLGEGSIGRVYKAKRPDGKVIVVKKISSAFFQDGQDEKFSDIISSLSKIYHPNIVELAGHCSEQKHNMLVYEYFRNGSIHEYLHLSDEFSRPLTWNTRVKIALGTARAVEYLHETCSLFHRSIKSSNILLDMELNPRLTECGLAIFYQDATGNLGGGWCAPECTNGAAYTFKSDVYSFGVVMLELLTGRMPYDSTKPKAEQYLVQWALSQLHDIDALESMVDPALRGLYPPKSISRFADIVALCVQTEPEFRPPMSEVVQSLHRLVRRPSMSNRGVDDFDY
ncbi:protein STRUBBELIG-RECEPTOR FAMILY 5-like [Chenopodium quinoa]|uniref:protein STRUBBELIG-RECEPTOR FAMILY 5-like n=1 Tax=Chenopodium quinoa TaxID=63459 RepID=UPI000B78CCD4|nr:protein STRUBBELIG-RECEPTOR FAMILY 5-like [Chenopodium quinoa]